MDQQPKLLYKILEPGAAPPKKAYITDAGLDLAANCHAVIPARGFLAVDTGIAVMVPKGYYATLEGRSGLSRKGIVPVRNIIDANYCGPLKVILHNIAADPHRVTKGDRIAQIVVHKCQDLQEFQVEEFQLETGSRGENGWGSSGG